MIAISSWTQMESGWGRNTLHRIDTLGCLWQTSCIFWIVDVLGYENMRLSFPEILYFLPVGAVPWWIGLIVFWNVALIDLKALNKHPDFFLTMIRWENKPVSGSFTFSMAPFFNIESTSFSNAFLFWVSDGSVTGHGVLDRGGRDLNFSFNPFLNVSKTQRSDVIFSQSAMKCFSLPPPNWEFWVCWVGWEGWHIRDVESLLYHLSLVNWHCIDLFCYVYPCTIYIVQGLSDFGGNESSCLGM